MRLSVVMPCHNRLHLLKDAIETVRMQSVQDWQLVVFDNCSADPIEDHIKSLGDARIVFGKSDEFLPVTESWNRALELSDGDYVVLLGDDDGLLPDAIARLAVIVDAFQYPDFVYADIYQFWHKGVAPWREAPHLVDVRHGFFFSDRSEPFRLPAEDARRAVIGSLDLKISFSFNSQACFYSRSFVKRLTTKDGFFLSPFPDYYIANVALAVSRSTVIEPQPLAFAGVSKASYGYALYNNEQGRGDKLLNISYERDPVFLDVRGRLLPGPTYNTNFILAMEHVARAVRGVLTHPASFARYRKMQMIAILRGSAATETYRRELRPLLNAAELVWAGAVRALLAASRHWPALAKRLGAHLDALSSMSGSAARPLYSPDIDCHSAVDVFEAFRAGRAM